MAVRKARIREFAEEVRELTPLEQQLARAEEEREEPDVPLDENVVFNNPYCPDEKFRKPGTSYFIRFAGGRFEATTVKEKEMAIAVLSAYGKNKVERWTGEDRAKPWECKKCVFISKNTDAIDDHRDRFLH